MTPMTKTTKPVRRASQAGLSLLELLIAMAIMGVLMLAFTQLFGGSLRASSSISARNELLSEGQIAQQLVVSKLKQAYFIYPTGTNIRMTSTVGTSNTIRGGQNWTVGADPIVAMILPPRGSDDPNKTTCPRGGVPERAQDSTDMCFTFYAYYPIKRSTYIEWADPDAAPVADPANDDAWLLMEYRRNLNDPTLTDRSNNRLASPPNPNTANITGRIPRILVDYVQPPENGDPPLFNLNANGSIEFNLQMGRNQGGKMLELPPLGVRAYPRNAP